MMPITLERSDDSVGWSVSFSLRIELEPEQTTEGFPWMRLIGCRWNPHAVARWHGVEYLGVVPAYWRHRQVFRVSHHPSSDPSAWIDRPNDNILKPGHLPAFDSSECHVGLAGEPVDVIASRLDGKICLAAPVAVPDDVNRGASTCRAPLDRPGLIRRDHHCKVILKYDLKRLGNSCRGFVHSGVAVARDPLPYRFGVA